MAHKRTGPSTAPAFAGALRAAALVIAMTSATAEALLTSGQLLTNFASATFNLPSGGAALDTDGGTSNFNLPNSQTAWVLITDSPQLCMKLWKQPTDTNWNPITSQFPGGKVCFQISFSNCGGYTGFSVMLTDVLPANVTMSTGGTFWISGGYQSITTCWATSLGGPWFCNSLTNTGLTAPLYMRWILGHVGMGKSGFIRYCATVI